MDSMISHLGTSDTLSVPALTQGAAIERLGCVDQKLTELIELAESPTRNAADDKLCYEHVAEKTTLLLLRPFKQGTRAIRNTYITKLKLDK